MSGALVDTNVLLDLATDDPNWANWSLQQLEAGALRGPLFINDVIYAELSVRFAAIETLDAFIAEAGLVHAATPRSALFLAAKAYQRSRSALFLAAKAYQRYRASGGVRSGVLPDFFIGAHAAVADLPLLTRDAARYRTYFPKLALIAP